MVNHEDKSLDTLDSEDNIQFKVLEVSILLLAFILGIILGLTVSDYVNGDYKMLTAHDIEIVSEMSEEILMYDVIPEINVKYTLNSKEYFASVIVTDSEYMKLLQNNYKDELLITPLWYNENNPNILYRTLKNAKNKERIVY